MTFFVITKSQLYERKVLLICLIIVCFVVAVGAVVGVTLILLHKEPHHHDDHHWNYHEQNLWPAECLIGASQSPIALSDADVAPVAQNFDILKFENVGFFEHFDVGNNGHSVTIRLDNCNRTKPVISGGGLKGNYTFDNMHFHWPSEHMINGQRYSLEAHLVFYSSKYDSLSDALEVPNEVAVVAILFTSCNETLHDNFRTIDESVQKVSKKVGETAMSDSAVNFEDFFPKNSSFFKYSGSLTTPNCTEHINWFVFKDISKISDSDLLDLRDIYTEDGELLEYNNRNLQSRNNRTVVLL